MSPAIDAVSDFLSQGYSGYNSEQHADVLEIQTEPLPPYYLENLEDNIREKLTFFREKSDSVKFLGLGTHPYKTIEDIVIPDTGRYNDVIDSLNPDVTPLEGLTAGIHINIEMEDDEELISCFNNSIMVEPYIIALGASSRFILGCDTEMSEARLPLIEKTLWADNRTGIPDYIDSLETYIRKINNLQHLDFEISSDIDYRMSTDWHDVRIRKNEDNTYRCEFRAVPQQPDISESVSLIAFYIGWINKACSEKKQLEPYEQVIDKYRKAIKSGIKAFKYDELYEQIKYAEEGLKSLGISPAILNKTYKRLSSGINVSDEFAEKVYIMAGYNSFADSIKYVAKGYCLEL